MSRIVLLPGLACDAGLWRHQLPALQAAGHAVVVSDVHAREATLPAMAAALLREHDGPLVLAGCSLGGMVAMEAARQAPQRVARLLLLGTSARADTPELRQLRADAIALFAQGRVDEVLQANLAYAFHPDHAADPALVGEYLAMVRRAGAAQLIAQNRAAMAREDLRPQLPRIACATLVVCGEADALTPPEHAREIAQGIAGASLRIVAGAGHMLTLEQPAAVNRLLLDALAGR